MFYFTENLVGLDFSCRTVCTHFASPRGSTIMWDRVFHKDLGHFWGVYGWHQICFAPFAEVVGHDKYMAIAPSRQWKWSSEIRSYSSDGCPTLHLCNLRRNRVCGPLVAAQVTHLQIQSSTCSLQVGQENHSQSLATVLLTPRCPPETWS